jgi:hypothetical protein
MSLQPDSPLHQIRAAYNTCLNLAEDDRYISDVLTSVYLSNVVSQVSEPVWIQVIGPPSSHKTESLRPLLTYMDSIPLSSLTANGLVSGHRDKDGNDPSLILKLDGKNLVIKDMTALHTMPRADRDKVFGDLRDAFDGSCSKASGMSGFTAYKARFGVVCAVTEVVDAFSKESQQLGERFLSFRTFRYLPTHRDACIYLQHVLSVAAEKAQWRSHLCATVEDAFSAIKTRYAHYGPPSMSDEIRQQVIILAHLLTQFRTTPVNSTPITGEMASRVVQQLVNLGDIHACADNRTEWNEDDLSLIRRIVIDTLPVQRRRLITVLYHNPTICPPPMGIEQLSNMSRMTQNEVSDLMAQYSHTGLVDLQVHTNRNYLYSLTPETRELLREVGLFHIGAHLPGIWRRGSKLGASVPASVPAGT